MVSEKLKKDIEAILHKYPNKKSAVMDALRIAQAGRGHLNKGDMEDISSILELRPVEVNAAAAFYTMYNIEKPVGRYHIQFCHNISCALRGGEDIIRHIEKTLDIKVGETTPDRKFTLSTVECLGSCGTAPVMQINDDYYENLTPGKVDEILKSLA